MLSDPSFLRSLYEWVSLFERSGAPHTRSKSSPSFYAVVKKFPHRRSGYRPVQRSAQKVGDRNPLFSKSLAAFDEFPKKLTIGPRRMFDSPRARFSFRSGLFAVRNARRGGRAQHEFGGTMKKVPWKDWEPRVPVRAYGLPSSDRWRWRPVNGTAHDGMVPCERLGETEMSRRRERH